ncbi:nocturnin isoform X2 [Lepeophtheirus salmonis]|uniref:Nocturnin n=1 Tax=Lepeophtheirus salmonis TaxID=72036 RepID=A0A0K2U124_LEPSM|nr:nocturnin-like isoform X2 [Lepeophtheirus salmonis]
MAARQLLLRSPCKVEALQILQRIKMENMLRSNYRLASVEPQTCIDRGLINLDYFHKVMGSFTAMPKVIPSANANDTDVDYPSGTVTLPNFIEYCSKQLSDLPPPLKRTWTSVKAKTSTNETIRLLQWNVLSQTLGTTHDNFVQCPEKALIWRTRRYRMLEEVARFVPDVICLQEVDHFRFLNKSLECLGYSGHFFPKPDSPCLYLPNNSGPDGCAIFYRTDKFTLTEVATRNIEVWNVQSNQVALNLYLKSISTQKEISIGTTHLKAKTGPLLMTLRNEQGQDLLRFLKDKSSNMPTIICGDFNAEPSEPVYETMISNKDIRLKSAYQKAYNREPKFTTWKIREDGEHMQTLDYIFHTNETLDLLGVLDMPDEEEIGKPRLPSPAYASDHLSLVADFEWK